MKNFKTNIFLPGQLVRASTDLFFARPEGALLVSEGTIGTVMAPKTEEGSFYPSLLVCFEGTDEWYVSDHEIELIKTGEKE